MHLIYSALQTTERHNQHNRRNENEMNLRYQAYLATCDKHQKYIAEIQKYFPNWMPRFR